MPRYYFDVDDGRSATRDDIGLDLDGDEIARHEALRALPGLAGEALPQEHGSRVAIEVRDGTGRRVLRATLTLAVERPG